MDFKDLKPERPRGSEAGPHPLEAMAEVATAAWAVVFGRPDMEDYQLVVLARVLQRAPAGGLDANARMLAVQAAWSRLGPGVYGDRVVAINPFGLQLRKA